MDYCYQNLAYNISERRAAVALINRLPIGFASGRTRHIARRVFEEFLLRTRLRFEAEAARIQTLEFEFDVLTEQYGKAGRLACVVVLRTPETR